MDEKPNIPTALNKIPIATRHQIDTDIKDLRQFRLYSIDVVCRHGDVLVLVRDVPITSINVCKDAEPTEGIHRGRPKVEFIYN